jgi:outer membrane protein assembly factor BamB
MRPMSFSQFLKAACFVFPALLMLMTLSAHDRSGVNAASGPRTGAWLTFGHDSQRSGWSPDEESFTPQNVSRLRLVWKAALPNKPRELAGLTAPLVAKDVETKDGRRDIVIVAGSSDHMFALDARDGALVWNVDFEVKEKPRQADNWLCPNALTATPTIDATRGRVFVVASDGRLFSFFLANGKELAPAIGFLPAFSKMWSLNYVNGIVYSTLSQECNDARSAVVAMSADGPGHVTTTFFSGGGIWGRGGAAADFEGNIYAATGDAPFDPAANQFGDSVVRLDSGLKSLNDFYTPPNWQYLEKLDLDLGDATPVIFRWRNRILAAVGGKEGRIYLMDSTSIGGTDHHSAVYVSPVYSNAPQIFIQKGIWGGLSAWTDVRGQVWLCVPTWGPAAPAETQFTLRNGEAPHGSVMAFMVVADKEGRPTLKPVWRSRDISVPEPVGIAGGVVFALGSGENALPLYDEDMQRFPDNKSVMTDTKDAVLYALNATTGEELWNSGSTITDWTHFSGIAVGAGKVFVSTNHGELYAFGLTDPLGTRSYRKDESTVASVNATRRSAAAETNSARPPLRPGDPIAASLFRQNCALCHGVFGNGDVATHAPDFQSEEWQSSRTDAMITRSVKDGKSGGMPAFGQTLTDEQVHQLIQYIRNFGPSAGPQN